MGSDLGLWLLPPVLHSSLLFKLYGKGMLREKKEQLPLIQNSGEMQPWQNFEVARMLPLCQYYWCYHATWQCLVLLNTAIFPVLAMLLHEIACSCVSGPCPGFGFSNQYNENLGQKHPFS